MLIEVNLGYKESSRDGSFVSFTSKAIILKRQNANDCNNK